jgi:hypothetical protein
MTAPPDGWEYIGSATVEVDSEVIEVGPVVVPEDGRLVAVVRQTTGDQGFNFGFCLLRFVPVGNEPGAVAKVWASVFWCVVLVGEDLTPGCEGVLELEPRSFNLAWIRSGFQLALDVAAKVGEPPPPPPPAWSPSDLTRIFYFDFAESSKVTVSGGALTAVADRYENGSTAVYIGGPAPAYGSINGKGCMVTTGDSCLALGATVANVRCFAIVVDFTTLSGIQFIVGDSDTYDFCGDLSGAEPFKMFDPGYASLAVLNGSARVNGASVAPPAVVRLSGPSIYIFNTTGNVRVRYFSRDRSYGRGIDGKTGMILALPAPLSVEDCERLEGWEAQRFGFADRLPAGHRFKTAAPS